jgi:hypothetical protein
MIPILLLAVTITFRPSTPTVGDLITVQAAPQAARIVLDPSPQYEIVSRAPNAIMIRTFEAKPIVLSGRAGNEKFSGIVIPIRSVLKKNDAMEPAPLIPPRTIPYPRAPFIAITATALVAIAAWLALFFFARRRARKTTPVPLLSPVQRFRAEVAASKGWAALADATRHYLAANGYGPELTTRELLSRAPEEIRPILLEVLREGDLDKFSPWGSAAPDFGATAARALTLADHLEPKPAA